MIPFGTSLSTKRHNQPHINTQILSTNAAMNEIFKFPLTASDTPPCPASSASGSSSVASSFFGKTPRGYAAFSTFTRPHFATKEEGKAYDVELIATIKTQANELVQALLGPTYTPESLAWHVDKTSKHGYKWKGDPVQISLLSRLPIKRIGRMRLDYICSALEVGYLRPVMLWDEAAEEGRRRLNRMMGEMDFQEHEDEIDDVEDESGEESGDEEDEDDDDDDVNNEEGEWEDEEEIDEDDDEEEGEYEDEEDEYESGEEEQNGNDDYDAQNDSEEEDELVDDSEEIEEGEEEDWDDMSDDDNEEEDIEGEEEDEEFQGADENLDEDASLEETDQDMDMDMEMEMDMDMEPTRISPTCNTVSRV